MPHSRYTFLELVAQKQHYEKPTLRDLGCTPLGSPNVPHRSADGVNTRTGKFELVRINDRGPYQEGREIDVSYRVARKLGLIHAGVSQVRLELMELPQKR